MKTAVAATFLLFTSSLAFVPCLKKNPNPPELILDEANRPENKYRDIELPDALDWRYVDGQRYTTKTGNQHIPNYCGACWAFSTTTALAERVAIMYGNKIPEWDFSVQLILDCDMEDMGCHGGDPNTAYAYMAKYGVTSETCNTYMATGHDMGRTCTPMSRCMTCTPHGGCSAQLPHQVWYVTEHGAVAGESDMIAALQDGPIVCGVAVTQELIDLLSWTIFEDTTGAVEQDHAITVVGYGVENDTKFWIVQNSWGSWWGLDGYFRIVRGINNLGIEEACSWATPADKPVWVNSTAPNAIHYDERPQAPKLLGGMGNERLPPIKRIMNKLRPQRKYMHFPGRPTMNDWEANPPVIINKQPIEYIDVKTLPANFCWNNINDTNFLAPIHNQHIPTYCGSCWAFGTTSALSARLSIMRGNGPAIWPEINLAPQVLINENGGGSCNGGNSPGAMRYIKENGIPDDTCQAYQAKNDPHGSRTELDICEDCVPGNTSATFSPGVCSPHSNFTLYGVTEYGPVRGVDAMKAEIYARGPIACGVDATPEFEAYTGGVFEQHQIISLINHEIAVVGWGQTDEGEDYWIGVNSWGVFWGEEGYFRIKMGGDNLHIEKDCTWGVPSFQH